MQAEKQCPGFMIVYFNHGTMVTVPMGLIHHFRDAFTRI
jgi:hypothetical protein